MDETAQAYGRVSASSIASVHKPGDWRAPSWSWASAEIGYRKRRSISQCFARKPVESCIRLVDKVIEPHSQNVYGKLISASITLEGFIHCRKAERTIEPHPFDDHRLRRNGFRPEDEHEQPVEDDQEAFFYDNLYVDKTLEAHAEIWYLLVARSYGPQDICGMIYDPGESRHYLILEAVPDTCKVEISNKQEPKTFEGWVLGNISKRRERERLRDWNGFYASGSEEMRCYNHLIRTSADNARNGIHVTPSLRTSCLHARCHDHWRWRQLSEK